VTWGVPSPHTFNGVIPDNIIVGPGLEASIGLFPGMVTKPEHKLCYRIVIQTDSAELSARPFFRLSSNLVFHGLSMSDSH